MKSVQLFSTVGLKLDTITPMNERARINTGFLCNYGCEFCYYKDKLDQRDSFEQIKERIDDVMRYGINQVDLSGGESSIEPNWFNILDYCNSKNLYISTLSHGGKFCDYEFLKKSKEHGLKEILFSLHGSSEEVHDSITKRKGSFNKIITAIKNAKSLNILVRINCTISEKNYLHLDEYITLLKQFNNIFELNFLPLNYWSDAKKIKKMTK